MGDKFLGFRRENGTVGVRNLIAIIPSVFCSAKVAQRISESVPGTVHFSIRSDAARWARTWRSPPRR